MRVCVIIAELFVALVMNRWMRIDRLQVQGILEHEKYEVE